MAPMRVPLILLALGAVSLAQDPFDAAFKEFESIRDDFAASDARPKVIPAVDALVATGDARAAGPLAAFLVATLDKEAKTRETIRDVEAKGADAYGRMQVLEKQIDALERRIKAGQTKLTPERDRLLEERDAKVRAYHAVRGEVSRMSEGLPWLQELREAIAKGCEGVLQGLSGEALESAFAAVREQLALDDQRQALYLVRMLRNARKPESDRHLIAILDSPKATRATLRATISALSVALTPAGAEALMQLWERDPEGSGAQVRHALSMAARRDLASIDEAKKWIGTLATGG